MTEDVYEQTGTDAAHAELGIDELVSVLVITCVQAVEKMSAIYYTGMMGMLLGTDTEKQDIERLTITFWIPVVRRLREEKRIPAWEETQRMAEIMILLPIESRRMACAELYQEVLEKELWRRKHEN